MVKTAKGSVTVFVALSFMMVVSLIGALIESARLQGARIMVASTAHMALDSLFSRFETELLEQYGVLLFDGADGGDVINEEVLAEKVKESMECNLSTDYPLFGLKGHDFYNITVDSVSVNQLITAPDAYGLVWRTMIDDYAKLDYSVELLESLIGIEEKDEESRKIQTAVEYMDKCYETEAEVSLDYLELIEHLDGVKTTGSGIRFDKLKCKSNFVKSLSTIPKEQITAQSISINDARVLAVVSDSVFYVENIFSVALGYFEEAVNEDFKNTEELESICDILESYFSELYWEIGKCMRLITDIKSGRDNLFAQIAEAGGYVASLAGISTESMESLTNELGMLQGQGDDMQERIDNLDNIYNILSENYALVEQIRNNCPDVHGLSGSIKPDASEISTYYEQYKSAKELAGQYRTDGMYLDYTGLECREEDSSILGCIYDYAINGICGLVLPKGTEISEKSIGNLKLADLYGVRGDRAEYITDGGNDIINEALFSIYIGDHFETFVENDGAGLLDYEQEFILSGKSSDKDNLNNAILSIAGIRLACNLAYIYLDAGKKGEAYEIALAALGFTGIMALVKALEYTILFAWAIGETVIDLKRLLNGETVAVAKNDNNWQLTLSNLISGNLDFNSKSDEKGLTYSQYLSCAIMLERPQEKAYRTMAAVEMHMIGEGVDNFRLKNYIYGMQVIVEYHIGDNKRQYTEICSYTY